MNVPDVFHDFSHLAGGLAEVDGVDSALELGGSGDHAVVILTVPRSSLRVESTVSVETARPEVVASGLDLTAVWDGQPSLAACFTSMASQGTVTVVPL